MDEFYMQKAYEQAEKSTCLRAKIGCVLVKNGEIVSQGYNNVVGGIEDCVRMGCIRERLNIPSGTRREMCRSICAEQLAVSEAARNGVEIDGATAYTTTFPCHVCAKILVSSGIKEIVYDNSYPDEMSKNFLMEAGIETRKI